MSHQHAEAFAIMVYKCEKCDAIERFWNSRDGVTPFIVTERCIRCLGDMQHFDFHLDKCAPDHVPYRGQGVFTDMSDALKRTYAHIRTNNFRAAGGQVDENTEQSIYESFQPGEPFFFRWRS